VSRWFDGGLRFSCTQCGNCCTGAPGYVWLSPPDEAAVAAHLGLATAEFRRRYTRLVGDLLSLVEKPNGDCVFLTDDHRCAIQPVKPRQCLTFPFWPRLVASRAAWREAAEGCPGIGSGALFPADEIETIGHRDTPKETLWRLMARRPASD